MPYLETAFQSVGVKEVRLHFECRQCRVEYYGRGHLGQGLVGGNADTACVVCLLPHAPPNALRYVTPCTTQATGYTLKSGAASPFGIDLHECCYWRVQGCTMVWGLK